MSATHFDLAPAVVLALAGFLRVPGCRHSPVQRDVVVALLSAAAAAAVTTQAVESLLPDGYLAVARDLAWVLLSTAAAAAALAMARHISLSSALLPWPPLALGLAVGLLQLVLLYAALQIAGDAPGSALARIELAEVAALWLVTLAAPVLACCALITVMWRYGPVVESRTVRSGLGLTFWGLLVLGVSAVATAIQVIAGPPAAGASTGVPAPAVDVLAGAGLVLVAAGFLLPRVARWATPVQTWFAARRLSRLAATLVAAADEWADRDEQPVPAVGSRSPTIRLYREVILIRDASLTLLSAVDDDVVSAALEFARRKARAGDELAVMALAEACWLRWAVRARHADDLPATTDDELVFLDRHPAEDLGSLRDEVSFLTAVSRAWDAPAVREFLATLHSSARPAP